MAEYAELHCLSNFSFLKGASHPEELVERALALQYQALAITDECSVAGVVRAWQAARKTELKLIIGSEFRLEGAVLVLLAMDRDGYGQLCELISRCRRRAEKGRYQIFAEDLTEGLERCLLLYRPAEDERQALTLGRQLIHDFDGRCWLLLERLLTADDQQRYRRDQRLARQLGLPCVAASAVQMHHPERQPLQDILTAIRLRTSVQRAGYALMANGERHLRSWAKLQHLYTAEELAQTLVIAERCQFELGELRYEYPS